MTPGFREALGRVYGSAPDLSAGADSGKGKIPQLSGLESGTGYGMSAT